VAELSGVLHFFVPLSYCPYIEKLIRKIVPKRGLDRRMGSSESLPHSRTAWLRPDDGLIGPPNLGSSPNPHAGSWWYIPGTTIILSAWCRPLIEAPVSSETKGVPVKPSSIPLIAQPKAVSTSQLGIFRFPKAVNMENSTESSLIQVRVDNKGVAIVKINRPEKRNALSQETINCLVRAVKSIEQDDKVRVVVFTGRKPEGPFSGM